MKRREYRSTRIADLTSAQRDVVRRLALGEDRQEIADALQISVKTVDSHRMSIFNRLGEKNLATLVHRAIREGVIVVAADPLDAASAVSAEG